MKTQRKTKKTKARQVIGIHSCMETIKIRPRKIRSIYIQENWNKHSELKWVIEQTRRYKIDYFEQTKEQLASWGQNHQGIALIVEENPLLTITPQTQTLIYIDGVEDPRNLGSILRTSWLLGVDGICLPTRNSLSSLTNTVCKVACGGAEHVPVQFLKNPILWFKQMKQKDFWIYGLDKGAKNSLEQEVFSKKCILAVGSEGKGLRLSIKNQCDSLLSIHQKTNAANYNLSIAVALGLYQRHTKQG